MLELKSIYVDIEHTDEIMHKQGRESSKLQEQSIILLEVKKADAGSVLSIRRQLGIFKLAGLESND